MDKLQSKTTKDLSWQGPSTRPFPKDQIRLLVLQGLAGLVCYIKWVDKDTLVSWDPTDRKLLAHNGSFRRSLFASPGKKEAEAYIHQKEKVKTARKAFEDGAATDDIPATIEIGVSRVVAELKKKNIVIDDAKKNAVYEALESVL
jgi:hypothetical protein